MTQNIQLKHIVTTNDNNYGYKVQQNFPSTFDMSRKIETSFNRM